MTSTCIESLLKSSVPFFAPRCIVFRFYIGKFAFERTIGRQQRVVALTKFRSPFLYVVHKKALDHVVQSLQQLRTVDVTASTLCRLLQCCVCARQSPLVLLQGEQ